LPRAGQGIPEAIGRTIQHPTGTEYFIIPGGPIPRDVGDELITMPDIRPLDSSLFPDHGQTWEMVR
jgi:hypothetical protein